MTFGERTTEDKIGDAEATITGLGRDEHVQNVHSGEASKVEACAEGAATGHDVDTKVATRKQRLEQEKMGAILRRSGDSGTPTQERT